MMKSKLAAAVVAATLAVGGGATATSAMAADGLMVGTAIRDVTPVFDMLPIIWGRSVELVGVIDPIHVRVLAVDDGDSPALIISTETGRGPYGPQFAKIVSEHTGLPMEAILYTATHSHAAPEWSKEPLDFDKPIEEASGLERWARMHKDLMLEAVDEALANMQPATVGIGHSESYINVNRGGEFVREVDGKLEDYVYLGWDPTAVSDKELVALEFRDLDGKPIAFVVDYAVHGVVMHGNTMGKNGGALISSDVPGYVSSLLEQENEGAVALWLSGAAGDQNPIVGNQILTREPATGAWNEVYIGEYELLNYLGRIHYYDIQKALWSIEDTTGDVEVSYDLAATTIPASDGGEFDTSLQLLRIGDIALIGFPGELYTQLGMDIKAASPLEDTLVVTHTRQREEDYSGYHPSDLGIEVAGHGATNVKYEPGYLSQALVDLTKQLIK